MYSGDLTTFKPKLPLVTLAVEEGQPSTSAHQQLDDIFGQSDASLCEWESTERDIADDESDSLSLLSTPPHISDEENSLSGRESFRTGERSYTASEAEDQEIVSSVEYQQILVEVEQGLGEESRARDQQVTPNGGRGEL